eukprot:GFUD01038895.1.p1 GENE.GFUD01038895.1~~GFUD01038895.1.p1  ORF type:complete len:376 (-),score=88.15 GFUD01038895.1:23-1123(-)
MEAKRAKFSNNDVETKRRKLGNEQQVVDDVDEEGKEDSGENETELASNKIRELQEHINEIEQENDVIKKDRVVITKDRDAIKKERDDFKIDRDAIEKDRDAIKKDSDAFKEICREQVECPVCLEVPTSGPVHVCPRGHLVCSTCKGASCPTCRTSMLGGKSLLAVTVMENIEHECRHEDCDELLPLEEYKLHLKLCPHRSVRCPAPQELCGKDLPLSKVYDHIVSECQGSSNEKKKHVPNDEFPVKFSFRAHKSCRGFGLSWKGVHFYLSFDKVPPFLVFNVQLIGNASECQDYEVHIAVHRPVSNDDEMEGKHVQRYSGEPLSIDMEREVKKQSGLIVSTMQMKKISVKVNDASRIGITIDVKSC